MSHVVLSVRAFRRTTLLVALALLGACAESSEPVAPETPFEGPRLAMVGPADFWARCDGIVCEFNSTNWDSRSQRWSFGDGAYGTGPQVLHTFPETGGSFLVTYTVTDLTGVEHTKERWMHILVLSAVGTRYRGNQVAQLSWVPLDATMDIYRDGNLIATVTSDAKGKYADNLGRKDRNASHAYQVCNAGTTYCSNFAVAWP